MSFKLSTGNVVNASSSGSVTSNGHTSATVTVYASAGTTNGWVQSTGVVARITINGSTSDHTIFGNGSYYSSSQGTITVSKSVSVSKGTSAKSVSWSVQFWQATEGTMQSNKQTDSGSVSVSAITSYTVSFNANGGSGAPAAQTKWYGTNLTLSSTVPTRTGYTFLGWGTSASDTTVDYAAGASYTSNAGITLYAIWRENTFTISYNANGGSGAPAAQTKYYTTALTLSSTRPTRTNYNFLGWATSASATTAQYSAGGSFTTNATTTLYAVWELAYIPPVISNLNVQRCLSDGTLDPFGTYLKATFSWELCQITGTNTIKSITAGYKLKTATSYSVSTVTASGTSGTASPVFGGGAISTDNEYDVQIKVTDNLMSTTTTANRSISTSAYTIDFRAGGTGVAIGKAATEDNLFDSALPFRPSGGIDQPYLAVGTDLNTVRTPNTYSMAYASNYTNCPFTGNTLFVLQVFETGTSGQVHQIATALTKSGAVIYDRSFYNSAWGSWVQRPSSASIIASLTSTNLGTILFPVGSIVIRYDHTDPASLYGGTWVRIANRFLYASAAGSTIGTTGGSNTHTLTIAQIPSHAHAWYGYNTINYGSATRALFPGNDYAGSTGATGGSGAHNNNPAYIYVSVWRRSA